MQQTNEQILREGCDWIARLQARSPSSDEQKALADWMSQSPMHRETLQQLAREWHELNVLTELAVPLSVASTESSTDRGQSGPKARVNAWLTWGGAALCSLVLAVALFVGMAADPEAPSREVYATARGEQKHVALPDGSTATLNSGSTMTIDFSVAERNVQLIEGEAHFEVTSQPQRPFRVQAGNSIFRAVGTAFTVRLKPDTVEITVVEGSVKLGMPASAEPTRQPVAVESEPLLGGGERLIISEKTNSVILRDKISQTEVSRQLAWRTGKVLFNGETLAEVVAEINRHSDMPIVVDGTGLEDLRIGGSFDIGERRKFLDALQASFGLRIIYAENDTVFISRGLGG